MLDMQGNNEGVVTAEELRTMALLIVLSSFIAITTAHLVGVVDDMFGALSTGVVFLAIEFYWNWLGYNRVQHRSSLIILTLVTGFVMLLMGSAITVGLTDDLRGGYIAGCVVFVWKHNWNVFRLSPDPKRKNEEI